MVPHAGPDSRVFREVTEVGAALARIGELAGSTITAKWPCCTTADAWWALNTEACPPRNSTITDRCAAAHRALWDAGVTVDFAHPEQDLSRYPLVLAPALFLLSDAGAENLRGYIAAGGVLLVQHFSGVVDTRLHARLGGYPAQPLREALGIRVEEYRPLRRDEVITLSDGSHGSIWSESVRAEGAETLADYTHGMLAGSPALTRHRFGTGQGWYVSTHLDDAGYAVPGRAAAGRGRCRCRSCRVCRLESKRSPGTPRTGAAGRSCSTTAPMQYACPNPSTTCLPAHRARAAARRLRGAATATTLDRKGCGMRETQRTAHRRRRLASLPARRDCRARTHRRPRVRRHAASGTLAAPNTAMAAVAAMQPSWNLGNTLDAIPDETSWGNPPVTKALFDTIRAQGFHSVRIPVTWSGHQSATSPYSIDPTFMSRVKQVVDWALSDGLYVELNVHHDSWQWIANMATDHDNVLARYDATWQQIATEFKDEPARLLFESVNEPEFNNTTQAQALELLNELNTSFHTVVRQSGGRNATRLLVLPTLGCTPDQDLMDSLASTMSSLDDHNLVATVHYYGYWPFSANIAGSTQFDATSQQDMTAAFTRMHDTFIAKGIPVYLGEDGLLSYPDYTKPYNNVEPGEALKYFEALGYQARINGVTTALWDPGTFLDRDTLQWRDPGLTAMIRSSWTTRSGTASSDSVYVSKSSPITAKTLTLNPNGTTFLGLWQGNRRLAEGRDYTVSGDQLTLTMSALTRLTGTRAYGVDATLDARFSCGVPWQLNVITYDTPVQANATGPPALRHTHPVPGRPTGHDGGQVRRRQRRGARHLDLLPAVRHRVLP